MGPSPGAISISQLAFATSFWEIGYFEKGVKRRGFPKAKWHIPLSTKQVPAFRDLFGSTKGKKVRYLVHRFARALASGTSASSIHNQEVALGTPSQIFCCCDMNLSSRDSCMLEN